MLSDIALCSHALIKLGADAITSFEDGSFESEVANGLYSMVRDSVISAHPWTFATGQFQLSLLTAEPIADYAYAFQLPADFLRALSVGAGTDSGRGTDYRIHERRVHANVNEAVLTYIFRPDETTWPPFFDAVLIDRLTAEFCMPITDSASRTEALQRVADRTLRNAKTVDSQQQTPDQITEFALISARGVISAREGG